MDENTQGLCGKGVIGTRDLIKIARSGDTEAFIALIEANRQTLYKVARGFFSEPMDMRTPYRKP